MYIIWDERIVTDDIDDVISYFEDSRYYNSFNEWLIDEHHIDEDDYNKLDEEEQEKIDDEYDRVWNDDLNDFICFECKYVED